MEQRVRLQAKPKEINSKPTTVNKQRMQVAASIGEKQGSTNDANLKPCCCRHSTDCAWEVLEARECDGRDEAVGRHNTQASRQPESPHQAAGHTPKVKHQRAHWLTQSAE